MDDADPAQAFFGDEEVDLYGALELSTDAAPDAIRKAYRRLSLLHHPDKVATAPPAAQEAAKAAFQRIGFAYSVLSDEKRRARFDKTGRTDAAGAEPDEGWDAYFAELWNGEVSAKTLDDFFDSYEGSAEEKEDLANAYNESSGSIEHILEDVPARNNLLAETRFTELVNAAIDAKELTATAAWKKAMKDTKGKAKRAKAAEKEAAEAEAAAKELGVHDKLFGGGGGKGKKGKGKAAANGEGDEDALKALIQQRGAARMDALIDNLEAKYGKSEGKAKGRKGKRATEVEEDEPGTSGKRAKHSEPTEEEFARIQAEIDARKNGTSKPEKAKRKGRS